MQPNSPKRPNRPAGTRPQFFDVVRPGRTPASPNSRPVLASNRPPVPDTSMKPSGGQSPKMGAPAVPPGLLNQPAPQGATPAPPVAAPSQPQPVAKPVQVTPAPPFAPAPARQQDDLAAAEPEVHSPASPRGHADQAASRKHKTSIWSEVLAILAIVLLVAIIINILLDADIINLPLPHTNFFEY